MDFPENFLRCEGAGSVVWMAAADGFEINVPGTAAAPNDDAVSLARRIYAEIMRATSVAEAFLSKFSRWSTDWSFDALVIKETAGVTDINQCELQYSHPSDVYGLWQVHLLIRDNSFVLERFGRVQT